jgi:hypothetical protein
VDWDVALTPAKLVDRYIETSAPTPLPLIQRALAYELHSAWAANRALYEQLTRHFRAAAGLLGVEMLSLLAATLAFWRKPSAGK